MKTIRASSKAEQAAGASGEFVLQEQDLALLSRHAAQQTYPKNAVIINEGDDNDLIYIIRVGRVKVFVSDGNGRDVVLNVHGPGEYFGEMVLDEGPRSASVMTLEPARLLLISKVDFRRIVLAHPDFTMRFIGRLMHRVRALTQNVRNLALLDVYGRVARLLLEIAVEQDGRLVIPHKLTQKNIAERVGASREMVSRVLKDLTVGGYIKVETKRIIIMRDLPERW